MLIIDEKKDNRIESKELQVGIIKQYKISQTQAKEPYSVGYHTIVNQCGRRTKQMK